MTDHRGDGETVNYNYNDDRSSHNERLWFPRIVSSYALTESIHWSRRLDADANVTDGIEPTVVAAAVATVEKDFYGREDADAAFLKRKPVSFAIFGKPGLLTDSLADALSAYWGCVHVSVARALAAGRADPCTEAALRNGHSVRAARTGVQLTGLLGLETLPEIREGGYVLTGLPRNDQRLSAEEQLEAVFACASPPTVLIYMSCPDRDLYDYRGGLVLESLSHSSLTQTLHRSNRSSCGVNLRWYGSPRARVIAELDTEDYEDRSWHAIETIVKQFNPELVITVDGRRPIEEQLETVKARLTAAAVHRLVRPEIVSEPNASSHSSLTSFYPNEIDELVEGSDSAMETVTAEMVDGASDENGNETTATRNREEQTRSTCEFGRLCPVSFSYGRFKMAGDRYRAEFMGKTYFFAGPEEMKLFVECPRRFVHLPRPGMPVRAIFYGAETLSNTAAKAVGNFFSCDLIDASYAKHTYKKQAYVSAVVDSVLKTARHISVTKQEEQSDKVAAMKSAIGDWIRLCSDGTEDDSSEQDTFEENQKIQNKIRDKEEQLIRLRNFFDLYGMDFIDDLDACDRAYNEPEILIKYFQNKSKENRRLLRLNFLKDNEIARLELMDVIVDNVRIRNRHNKNWIIVNAPLDFVLVKKLIAADLNPIQMVFFHDTDPMHSVLLIDDTSNADRNRLLVETFENVKNGVKSGTMVNRIDYSEYVNKIEKSVYSNNYTEGSDVFDDDYEIENHNEHNNNADHITHEQLMEFIIPVITERLNQYTNDLLKQWYILKTHLSNEVEQYMDFKVIECKPNSTTNTIKVLIEDTLYYIKKFLSDNVYDMSTTNNDDSVPTLGKYDGDTSIYCPVKFANGKLSTGSKKHMAIYQNRYYYMSSLRNLKMFLLNPNKYSSFSSHPKLYPKPKISILCSFGLEIMNFVNNVLNAFNLTFVDSYVMFKKNILPTNVPMIGKMYEEPTLKQIIDKYFISKEHNVDYVNSLRNYIDRESTYLNDENWWKMNSIYFQTDEGICYKNYPRNLTELEYLKEYEIHPDVIIEIVSDEYEGRTQAKKAVIKNWLTYQYELIDKVIMHDETTRRDIIKKRSIMFKNKLVEIKEKRKMDEVKTRLKRIINMVVTQTTDGPDTIDRICDTTSYENKPSTKTLSKEKCRVISSTNVYNSKYDKLTLKQKKIIIEYHLDVEDFLDLDDFTVLEKIEEIVLDELPEAEFLITKCFSSHLTFPSDAMIEQYLEKEKDDFANMRKFAESSNIPWVTVLPEKSQSATLNDIAKVLVNYNHNVFETTFNVDFKTSDAMLRSGEVYLSQFGRWCPVQVYEDSNSIQPVFAEDGIYPVVHRKYVYYLSGQENREKFARDPLKYECQSFSRPLDCPLRIAILGAPNSGKSRYARDLCNQYGFQHIRIEDFVQSYLTTYDWIDDVKSSLRTLYRGDTLSDDTLVEIVKWGMKTTRATTQGFVLDGFPTTNRQFRLMDDSGIILHKVFVMEYQDSYEPHEISEIVPLAMLQYRNKIWSDTFVGAPWISERYGNVTVVNYSSRDGCVDQMKTSLRQCAASLERYHRDVEKHRPARLADLPVTESECSERMSMYLDLCPVCRLDDDRLERPCDEKSLRRHLVQYEYRFYWICPRHWTEFSDDYRKYLDFVPVEPEHIPTAVTIEDVSRNPYSHDRHVSEICVVCALASLWNPVYRCVNIALMMSYSRFIFAFCSLECQRKFMSRPFFYCKYRMHITMPELTEKLVIDQLPVLGYLEQTIAQSTSLALIELTAAKPIFPGLSAYTSAMVFLGLSIGKNGTDDDDLREYYQSNFEQFLYIYRNFKTQVYKLKILM